VKIIHLLNRTLVISFFLGGISLTIVAAFNNSIPLAAIPENISWLVLPFLIGSITTSTIAYLLQAKQRMFTRLLEVERIEKEGLNLAVEEKTKLLAESENVLRNFFDQPMNLHLIAGLDGSIRKVNKGWKNTLGYKSEELVDSVFLDYVHPADVEATLAEMAKLGEGVTTVDFENRYRHKNGEYHLLSWSAIASAKDQIIYAVASDITDRKQAQVKQKESENKFRNLVSVSPVCIHEIDLDGRIISMNPAGLKMMGVEQEADVCGLEYLDVPISEDKGRIGELMEAARKGKGSTFEFCAGSAENPMYFSSSFEPIKDNTGNVIKLMGVTQNITRRKQAEASLIESERRLSELANISPLAINLLDVDGRFTFCNPAHEVITGYSPEESIGMGVWELITPEDQKNLQDYIVYLAENQPEPEPYYLTNIKKDGAIISTRVDWTYRKDNSGNVVGFLSITSDITERKQLEEQARRSQKMEAVGQLTGGIAHDFNNILGIVLGNLELLERSVGDDEKSHGRISAALKGARRGADLTRKLLGFSRKEAQVASPTALNENILSMNELLEKSLTVAVNIEYHLADDLWLTEIDPGDLQDAILNLSLNAHDAMPDGGTLLIETSNKILDDAYIEQNPGSTIGEYAMLSFSDTGVGMTQAVKEKVLEPFFTTKDEGQGSGLGLSMVYGFVQRSGGHINIYSEPGEGTTIRLFLPHVLERLEKQGKDSLDTSLPRGDETILVVDDEEALADIAVNYLEDLGYKTITANNGNQAMNAIKDNKDINLLFSDVIMPDNFDGYQLAQAAVELRPSLKAILTSGFTNKREDILANETGYTTDLARNILNKPYTQSELATAVRKTLDRKVTNRTLNSTKQTK